MKARLTERSLLRESSKYRGSGGISQNNRNKGYVPAFCDQTTGQSYVSRFADGRPAPIHLLDGLPASLIVARTSQGSVVAAKASVVAGFIHNGCFVTREQAARELAVQGAC